MLRDSFGRVHDYLRISITDKCNLRCSYCMPYDLPKGYFSSSLRMTAEEIFEIARLFSEFGVRKIRLTGGEPLVRKEFRKIIQLLSELPVELAVTTNGVLVDEFITDLKNAGIKSVNVSLDSLNPATFSSITRKNEYERVISNIQLLLKNDFHLKVNMVVIRGVNDNEVLDFIGWTKDFPLHVRFIEFMPFQGNGWSKNYVVSADEIREIISSKYFITKLRDGRNDTAKNFRANDFKGTFAIITTVSEPFCSTCNRLRISSSGKLRNCLFSTSEIDLLTPLRQGKNIYPLIEKCLAQKFFSRGGLTQLRELSGLEMRKIGG